MTVLDKHINALENGLTTASAKQTEQIAYALAPLIPANQVLAFHGDLGVGKTTFIRALAKSWGIKEHLTSPTYNLYKIYQSSNRCLSHELEYGRLQTFNARRFIVHFDPRETARTVVANILCEIVYLLTANLGAAGDA